MLGKHLLAQSKPFKLINYSYLSIDGHILSGVLVPGGFGQRGTEGMMLAITYAREKKVPFLGICLGFQLAVVEWARYKLKMKGSSYRWILFLLQIIDCILA